jgi:hypothetical protein
MQEAETEFNKASINSIPGKGKEGRENSQYNYDLIFEKRPKEHLIDNLSTENNVPEFVG